MPGEGARVPADRLEDADHAGADRLAVTERVGNRVFCHVTRLSGKEIEEWENNVS
jgi:hypothetical protein